jgi:hypothetical protein
MSLLHENSGENDNSADGFDWFVILTRVCNCRTQEEDKWVVCAEGVKGIL